MSLDPISAKDPNITSRIEAGTFDGEPPAWTALQHLAQITDSMLRVASQFVLLAETLRRDGAKSAEKHEGMELVVTLALFVAQPILGFLQSGSLWGLRAYLRAFRVCDEER